MSICMSCGTTHDCRGHNRIVAERDRLREDKRELLAALKDLSDSADNMAAWIGASEDGMDPKESWFYQFPEVDKRRKKARAALAKAQEAVR